MKKFTWFFLGLFLAVSLSVFCTVKYGNIEVSGLTFSGAKPFEASPSTTLAWKDNATVTLQAGNYYIGGKLLNLAANADWSWTLDTGSEASSTWYYLYAYSNTGVPTGIGSATAPTGRFNTNLSGTTYDTNIYLGAFYNNSSSNILGFTQNGNKFSYRPTSVLTSYSDSSYTQKTITVPASANMADILLKATGIFLSSGSVSAFVSVDGTDDYMEAYNDDVWKEFKVYCTIPIVTSRSLWVKKTYTGSPTSPAMNLYIFAWYDKWL